VRLSVATVGSHAQRLMDAAEDGTVIAVFARSLYLRDRSNRIACFGGPGLGAGPVNALCTAWPDEPAVMGGTAARWRAGVLALGDGVEFEAASAAPWRPATPQAWRDETLSRALVRLAAMPARGLGAAIPTLVSQAPLPSGDRFQMAAFQGLLALSLWLRNPAVEPPPLIATLIGLGPGLTPAGDDVLGGALVALRALGRGHTADRLAAWTLARARGATSDISFAHLAAAAEGEGAAALHDALVALAGDSEALSETVARLDRIGHSSGWDALAGSVAALVPLSQPG